MTKNVLFFIPAFASGGAEAFIVNLIDCLDKRKYLPSIVCIETRKNIYDNRINKLNVKKDILINKKINNSCIRYLVAYFEFYRFLKNSTVRYDIIHFNLAHGEDLLFVYIAKMLSFHTRIIHSHNSFVNNKIKFLFHKISKFLFSNCGTEYFSCSDLAAKWLFPKAIYNGKKFVLINNGINTKKFVFSNERRILKRDELKLHNKKVLINIGRLNKQKNQLFLIHVIKILKKYVDNVVLIIVGEGDLYNELQSEIIKNNLESNILLLGNRLDIPDLLFASDLFVLPSIYEGLPFTAIEAQATGLPCVISDQVSEQVKITSLVHFIPLNKAMFVKSIIEILNLKVNINRNKYAEVIEKENYDTYTMAAKIEKYYEKILTNNL